jgi:hypothetical protein
VAPAISHFGPASDLPPSCLFKTDPADLFATGPINDKDSIAPLTGVIEILVAIYIHHELAVHALIEDTFPGG